MTNWGSANMSVKQTNSNKGGSGNFKNEKYLSLKTSAVGENAEFAVRFLGDLHKFYTHWTPDAKRKICLKTAIIKASDGSSLYKKQNSDNSISEYTVEDVSKCPYCQRGDDPRPRYAANVIDMAEASKLAQESKPPIVRLMEFPTTVYQSIEYFMDKHKVIPSDLTNGPVFYIRLKYPKKQGLTKQDIQYEVDWTNPGEAPINAQEWEIVSSKLHNLVVEYNPYKPGSQNVFGEEANNNQNSFSNSQPSFNASSTSSGFGPSITGGNQFDNQTFSQSPQQQTPTPAPQQQMFTASPQQTQSQQPPVQPQVQQEPQQAFSFAQPQQQATPQNQPDLQPNVQPQQSTPAPQQQFSGDQSIIDELSNVLSNVQPNN